MLLLSLREAGGTILITVSFRSNKSMILSIVGLFRGSLLSTQSCAILVYIFSRGQSVFSDCCHCKIETQNMKQIFFPPVSLFLHAPNYY